MKERGRSLQLTEHFSLEEMTSTSHHEIDNSLPLELMSNMVAMAAKMEEVRSLLKEPIHVNSGYRCLALNTAIGGSKTSAHMDARACDFICPAYGTPADICEAIAHSTIDFDQLIFEHTWVHLGIVQKFKVGRREVLTLIGPNAYTHGIVKS